MSIFFLVQQVAQTHGKPPFILDVRSFGIGKPYMLMMVFVELVIIMFASKTDLIGGVPYFQVDSLTDVP